MKYRVNTFLTVTIACGLWPFCGLLNVFCLLSVLYVTACLVAIYSSSADYDYKYVTTIFNENTIYTNN